MRALPSNCERFRLADTPYAHGLSIAPPSRVKRSDGFTLLEVLIALSMLIVGVLALTELSTLAIRAADRSRTTSAASIAADQKLEQLRALPFGFDESGAAVQDAELAPSPPDALSRNTGGYFEYLDAAGRVLDAGADTAAAFIRRWSIAPLAVHPTTTLAIEVLVLPRAAGANADPAAIVQGGARRATIRTRRGL
jgi:type II secretory pathway pseudopilin PulG